jgi:hypothetical protein
VKRNALFAARADHVREKEKKASQLAVDSMTKTTDQKTERLKDEEARGGKVGKQDAWCGELSRCRRPEGTKALAGFG